MVLYLLDYGRLLGKDEPEFEAYSTVYDKQWGYYDEGQEYYKSVEEALAHVPGYVKSSDNHYVVITNQGDIFSDYCDPAEIDLTAVDYSLDSIEYSDLMYGGKSVKMARDV
jgi:hypothetical protein